MDPHVVRDPVFVSLLQKHEIAARKLRDTVIALRSFHLTTHKDPQHYTSGEQWRAAHLQETAVQRLEDVRVAAEDLLRYGYELAPHSSCPVHLANIEELKTAHEERTRSGTGWGETADRPRGIEEQVQVDGGPPITIVIKPSHYEFTDRAKKAQERRDSE